MSVEIIHDENDLVYFWIHLINEVLDLLSPVNRCAVFPDTCVMPAGKWFGESKNTARSVTYISRVNLFVITRTHSPGLSRFSKKLERLFVHT